MRSFVFGFDKVGLAVIFLHVEVEDGFSGLTIVEANAVGWLPAPTMIELRLIYIGRFQLMECFRLSVHIDFG